MVIVNAPLTQQELAEYDETGFLVRRGLFSDDEIARLLESFYLLESKASSLTGSTLVNGAQFVMAPTASQDLAIARVVWAGGVAPYLLSIGADERLTTPAMSLLETNRLTQILNQAHFKRPGDGIAFDWHQDIEHRDKGGGTWQDIGQRGSYVQTILVIDSMDEASGPIEFIPGSQRWGRVQFTRQDNTETCEHVIDSVNPAHHASIPVIGQPGDVIFFGPYAAHMSKANTSDHYRRVLVNGYATPGANHRVYPGAGLGRVLEH